MCTSFIQKREGEHFFAAMNFDNYLFETSLSMDKEWFVVWVDTGKQKVASFGVHRTGVFFNDLMVAGNEAGKYRRGKNVVHTTRFTQDLVNKTIDADHLQAYFDTMTLVNVPGFSTHKMVTDTHGNAWIIEPGRGVSFFALKPGESLVLTNTPFFEIPVSECGRAELVRSMLEKNQPTSSDDCFKILNQVKQSSVEWRTEFSMVYDHQEHCVHWCENQSFDTLHRYDFTE